MKRVHITVQNMVEKQELGLFTWCLATFLAYFTDLESKSAILLAWSSEQGCVMFREDQFMV